MRLLNRSLVSRLDELGCEILTLSFQCAIDVVTDHVGRKLGSNLGDQAPDGVRIEVVQAKTVAQFGEGRLNHLGILLAFWFLERFPI